MQQREKNKENSLLRNQKTLQNFFGKDNFENKMKFAYRNELQMLKIKLRLTLDANGLDFVIPGSSSSSSSINPLNTSSNFNITVEGNESQEIVISTPQITATVSSSSKSTSAEINVSTTLTRKYNAFFIYCS